MKKSGFYLKGIIALLAAVMAIGFSGCPMDGETEPAAREQYTDDAVLLNEKAKYITGFTFGFDENSSGNDITSRVIELKEGKRADTSIQVSVAGVDGSGFFGLDENGVLTLAAVPSEPSGEKEDDNVDYSGKDEEIVERSETLPDTGVITLQFKKGESVSTLDIIISIVKPGTEGARIAVKDGETFLLYGYDVINSSYINRSDVKITRPILDINKVNAADLVRQQNTTSSMWESAAGETITEMSKTLNVSAGGGYDGALFSLKVETNFTTGSSSKQTKRFATGRGIHYVKDEWLQNTSPEILAKMLDPYFEADLKTKNPADILKTYGTHLLGRVYWGGNAEYFYSYSGSEYTTNDSLKIAVEAAYAGVTGSVGTEYSQAKAELSNNASFRAETRGGSNTAFTSLDAFGNGYAAWVQSIQNQPTLAGIPNFDQDLIPIWEIARPIVGDTKADEIRDSFVGIYTARGSALAGYVYKELPAYVTLLNVEDRGGNGSESPPSGYTNLVRTDMYNPNGGREALDANRGAGGPWLRIAYKTAMNDNNGAIADIRVTRSDWSYPASYTAGYTKINVDLNKGVGGPYIYLWYRKVNRADTQAISFIGSYCEDNAPSGVIASGYSWVSDMVDLNGGLSKGKWIKLTVKKIPFTWKD
jgi:hypothetical protein